MTGMLIQAVLLVVRVLSSFLCFLLLARFFMQVFRVSFNNSIGYFVLQLTNWLVIPLRKIIPSAWGFDLSTLLPVFFLQLVEILLIYALQGFLLQTSFPTAAIPIIWITFKAFLRTVLYFIMFMIFLQAIFSWINPHSPHYPVFSALTAPVLRPIQRITPMIGRIDLSPLVAILLIQVILIFLQ